MFRIEVTGSTPGIAGLNQTFDDQAIAERVAHAIVSYLDRNRLPGHVQGAQVLDERGHWVWRQSVGSKPERLH